MDVCARGVAERAAHREAQADDDLEIRKIDQQRQIGGMAAQIERGRQHEQQQQRCAPIDRESSADKRAENNGFDTALPGLRLLHSPTEWTVCER
jgi:hypothetical protein